MSPRPPVLVPTGAPSVHGGHQRVLPGEGCGADRSDPAVHTHGSIGLLLAGESVLHMGSAWRLGDGDVFLVPEGLPHWRLDHRPSRFIGVAVCMSCLPADRWGPPLRALFLGIGAGACPVLRPGPAARDELAACIRALAACDGAGGGPPWLVDARLGLLTGLLLGATPAAQPLAAAGGAPVVARALDHIARHALGPLSLVDVAAAVGRAPSHLASLVKAETGAPVGAWIANARMAQARVLLLRGDDTVAVIGEKVGYASPSHFHRTFRRLHGLSPSAWRAAHRAGAR